MNVELHVQNDILFKQSKFFQYFIQVVPINKRRI